MIISPCVTKKQNTPSNCSSVCLNTGVVRGATTFKKGLKYQRNTTKDAKYRTESSGETALSLAPAAKMETVSGTSLFFQIKQMEDWTRWLRSVIFSHCSQYETAWCYFITRHIFVISHFTLFITHELIPISLLPYLQPCITALLVLSPWLINSLLWTGASGQPFLQSQLFLKHWYLTDKEGIMTHVRSFLELLMLLWSNVLVPQPTYSKIISITGLNRGLRLRIMFFSNCPCRLLWGLGQWWFSHIM